MERLDATAYLAARGYETQLRDELRNVVSEHGRLFVARGPRQPAHWAQNVWLEPVRLEIRSVRDAAAQLRALGRNWALYSFDRHRRAQLIQDELPHVSARPLVFPAAAPVSPLGSWTLLGPMEVLASPACTSPFPHGEARFVEDRTSPPNRAYLKLWEALTLLGARPGPGDRCLDAGAAPGGWTWVLAGLGARVVAIDRAPLDPPLERLENVEARRGSAFGVEPRQESFDWVLSDVVCYPRRLAGWIERWVAAGAVRGMVCTVKFQGASHYDVIPRLASIQGARLVHLFHNKHELTWLYLRPDGAGA